ncbi:MAG: type VI secretion system baseplate subunit TssF, partial [Pseudomonadota bacterium]
MDQSFLAYYEDELGQLRHLSKEFAQLHPTVARNLSLDSVPCPDPYVERLLEGVAFLAARTRLKLDYESSRYVRGLLDALYPDLAAPAPAMTMAELQPGPQVATMMDGHRVKSGTRLVAGLREGIRTRAVYTTAQPVDLWPIKVASAEYLQDRGALKAAGLSDAFTRNAEAGLKLVIERTGAGTLAEISLDQLDIYLGNDTRGVQLFDAIFGACRSILARPDGRPDAFDKIGLPAMVGLAEDEAMLPRVRASFEGYRLLREYFLMPERFHYVRLTGLRPTISKCDKRKAEVVFLFDRPEPRLSDIKADAFRLFVTPIVNLFERECNIVELDRRRTSHVVHADRTRPRDFEIFRLLRVEDAEQEGAAARLSSVYALEKATQCPFVFSTDRSPRRPSDDEVDAGQLRTSYRGDDFLISVARKP